MSITLSILVLTWERIRHTLPENEYRCGCATPVRPDARQRQLSTEEMPVKKRRILKILSIDDEPAILKCIEQALSGQGYELHVTSDAEEGLKMLKEDTSIDLALLDIRMPKKNGFDIYREVRKFRKLPVLFVTAYPGSFTAKVDEVVEMWKNEFADGTTDIIYKPFDLALLFEKVESLIGRIEAEGEQK